MILNTIFAWELPKIQPRHTYSNGSLKNSLHWQFQLLVRMKNNTNCHLLCQGWKMELTFWKTVGQFHTKLNIVLPYDLAVTLIYSSNLKTDPTKACKQMSVAALFIIPNTWTCPSAGEWVGKPQDVHILEHSSAIGR